MFGTAFIGQYSVFEGVSEVLGALTLFLFRNLYMIFMKSDCSVHLFKVTITTVTIEET